MGANHRTGRAGEDLAARFLEICGYTVLARRWRRPGGEIDLVAARGRELAFVEVKTRGPGALAAPEAGLLRRQRVGLRRAARAWLAAHPDYLGADCRCDLVAVDLAGEGRGLVLRHYRGAF